MVDKKSSVTVDGVEYPMAFNANVIEIIQEKYGDIPSWSDVIEPPPIIDETTGEKKQVEPKMNDLIWTFREIINEGIDINNDEKKENRDFLTHKQVGRIIGKKGFQEVANVIKNIVLQSSPDASDASGEEKNAMTTQK